MANPRTKDLSNIKTFNKKHHHPGMCDFCLQHKDIDGGYGYGKGWEDRYNFPLD